MQHEGLTLAEAIVKVLMMIVIMMTMMMIMMLFFKKKYSYEAIVSTKQHAERIEERCEGGEAEGVQYLNRT